MMGKIKQRTKLSLEQRLALIEKFGVKGNVKGERIKGNPDTIKEEELAERMERMRGEFKKT